MWKLLKNHPKNQPVHSLRTDGLPIVGHFGFFSRTDTLKRSTYRFSHVKKVDLATKIVLKDSFIPLTERAK